MNNNHILLLHGALGSASQFDELKLALDKFFTVHLLNFSGHGGASVPKEGFSLDLFEKDVTDYLQQHQLENIPVFGYSMGGYVALSIATKHPDKFSGLFTLATKMKWNPESAMKEAGILAPEIIHSKVPRFAEQLESRHHPADWKLVMEATAGFMKKLGDKPLTDDMLSSIKISVRMAVGDRDKMVSVEETKQTCSLFEKGSLLVLPQTPHPLESVSTSRLVYEISEFFLIRS